jgi:RNA polymerase sigma-32 factor
MTLPNTLSPSSAKAASAGALALSHASLLPGQLGNIDAYIQAVNRIPMLTPAEERQFATEFREQNNLESARRLVLSHLRLVVSIARNYLGYGLPHADLIQEGNIGLMKAVKRFDPEQNVRLVSYAMHWIKAEIHEYILRNWRMVKIATTKAQRKLFFNLRSMKTRSAALTQGEAKDIARELGVKPEEVLEMEMRLSGSDVALDPTPGDEETITPIAYLADSDDEPVEVLEKAETARNRSTGLRNAMAKLDDRSRRIIEARWLKEEDPATLQELADEYGVSAERIRQIESKALKTMRAQMADVQ